MAVLVLAATAAPMAARVETAAPTVVLTAAPMAVLAATVGLMAAPVETVELTAVGLMAAPTVAQTVVPAAEHLG